MTLYDCQCGFSFRVMFNIPGVKCPKCGVAMNEKLLGTNDFSEPRQREKTTDDTAIARLNFRNKCED